MNMFADDCTISIVFATPHKMKQTMSVCIQLHLSMDDH